MTMKSIKPEERKYIVIHSSFTRKNDFIGLREMEKKHRSQHKLSIGYHAVIQRDGIIEYGRPLNNAGAHLEGHDREALGICMIGGRSAAGKPQDNFTDAQFKNLKWLLNNLAASFPNANVVGHSKLDELSKCPHFSVSEFLMREGLAHLPSRSPKE